MYNEETWNELSINKYRNINRNYEMSGFYLDNIPEYIESFCSGISQYNIYENMIDKYCYTSIELNVNTNLRAWGEIYNDYDKI